MRTKPQWARSVLSLVSLSGELYMLSDTQQAYTPEKLDIIRRTPVSYTHLKTHTGVHYLKDQRNLPLPALFYIRAQDNFNGLIILLHAVDNAVFHNGLDDQLGDGQIPGALAHHHGIGNPLLKPQLLQLQVLGRKVKLPGRGGHIAVAADISEELGKLDNAGLQELLLPQPVKGYEAVQGVVKEVGVDLGLKRQIRCV